MKRNYHPKGWKELWGKWGNSCCCRISDRWNKKKCSRYERKKIKKELKNDETN